MPEKGTVSLGQDPQEGFGALKELKERKVIAYNKKLSTKGIYYGDK